jgi:chorismate mutase
MTEAAPKPALAPAPAPDSIEAIRAQIDAVDHAMLELVAKRLLLADGLGKFKNADGPVLPIRPAREVKMLRRLIAAAPAPVEPELVVELWRALIAANVRRQAPLDVAVGGGNDPVRLFDIARRHFGARTRIRRVADPQAALLRALEAPNTVAIVPWLAAPGVGSWWPALSESRFHKLHLVAGLPMRGAGDEEPEACLFATAPTEPAEGDVTMMIVFDPHHRAQKAMSEVGFKGREVARSEPRALIRIDGFVAVDDPRASAMTSYGLDAVRVLGSYARV